MMASLFSKPKAPSMPKVPPPPAIPEEPSPEDMAKRLRRRKGFRETILTGDLTPPKKKATLG